VNLCRVPLASFLISVVLVLATSPASAQSTNTEETFDEPLGAGWETSPTVSVTEGRLIVPPNEFAFRGGAWTDVTLDGLSYRGEGELFIDYSVSDGAHYTLRFFDDRVWVLEKTGPDGLTELAAQENFILPADQEVALEIRITAGNHEVTVDGESVLAAADESPLDPGGFAIHSGGHRTVAVGGITATGEDVPAPATEPGAPPAATAETSAPATTTTASTQSDGLSGRLDEFFSINTLGYGIGEAAINLALAAVLAFILGRVYVYWGAGLSNRRRFAANFMVVAVATTFIILVVRSSVALSLGLVGALSIVRFRAAIKDPEELTYMFLAIGIGIGLGDNQRLLTIIALAIAVVVIGILRLLRESGADFNLHVTVAGDGDAGLAPEAIHSALLPHCTRIRLSRFEDTPTSSESSFLVEFAGETQLHAARQALLDLSPDVTVTFLDDKGLW
jgi:hypothetical protein